MFENRPSLIDAYLFGYLSVLYRAPFVASPLKTHFTAFTNLISIVNRIQKDLFAGEIKGTKLDRKVNKIMIIY